MILTYKDNTGDTVTENVTDVMWKGSMLSFTSRGSRIVLQFLSIWDALECRLVNIGDALKAIEVCRA